MKFKPVNREDIPKSSKPSSKSATILREFLEAGVEVGEVELDAENDKPVESTRSSLDNYIVRHNLPLRVFASGGHLYVEKSDVLPADRPKRVVTPEQLAARQARKAAKAAAKAGTTPVVDEAAQVAEGGATEATTQPTGGRRQRVA